MKEVLLSFFIIISLITNVTAQEKVATIQNTANFWQQDFSKAEELIKFTKKPMLIIFSGSDWCGPCKMLISDVFESEKFSKDVQNNFILYKADFPRNKNLVTASQRSDNYRLKSKYSINSYPTIVIINEKGKVLGKKKGYNLKRVTSYHYSFFNKILKKLK